MIRPEGASQMHAGSGSASTSESSNDVGDICGISNLATPTIRGNQLFRVSKIEQSANCSILNSFQIGPPVESDLLEVLLQDDATALPAPIACPYCGRPLKWTSDHWREALECESCGKFSDFDSANSTHRDFDASPRHDQAPSRTTTAKDDAGEGSGS
jgi:hypothetical protein